MLTWHYRIKVDTTKLSLHYDNITYEVPTYQQFLKQGQHRRIQAFDKYFRRHFLMSYEAPA